MSYRKRVLAVTGGAIALLLLYWLSGYVFAYTDDAYVTSDLVAIAPQITGKVIAVHVTDNQSVTRGTPLLSLDPEPFRLEVAKKQAKLDEANAQLSVDRLTGIAIGLFTLFFVTLILSAFEESRKPARAAT